MRPLGFDLVTELVGAALLHQDLDARLVNVVAPAVAVIDAQDRLEIREQMRPGQEFADAHADHRRAAKPAAHQHAEADLALLISQRVQADVVHRHRGAVGLRAVNGDLELAWQERELRMERGPLADDFAPDVRVDDLVARDAGEMVGRYVAKRVA